MQKLFISHYQQDLGCLTDEFEAFFQGVCLNKSIQELSFINMDLLCGQVFTMLTPFFANNHNLTSIEINNCNFGQYQLNGNEGCRLFALAIGACKALEKVQLKCMSLADDDMVDIITALNTHAHHLQELSFEWCCLRGNESSILALTNLLRSAIELQSLDLLRCRINAEDIASLVTALASCCDLKELQLSGNSINVNGFLALSNLLQTTAIETLSLSSNDEATDEAIEVLVSGLMNYSHLKALCISRNQLVTSMGWQRLALVLDAPQCMLNSLSLQGNSIDDETVAVFASALENNRKLARLDLRSNASISAEGLQPFSKLVFDMSSINGAFLSNHILCVNANENAGGNMKAMVLEAFFDLNKRKSKEEVAMLKVLLQNYGFDIKPFFEWSLRYCP